MAKPTASPEVRRFIRAMPPPETFTHLAAELRARFKLDLSPDAAAQLWRSVHRPRPGRASGYAKNAALMAFIADRADLVTVDQLRGKIAQTFGLHLTPSRSQLFRLVQQAREVSGGFQRASDS